AKAAGHRRELGHAVAHGRARMRRLREEVERHVLLAGDEVGTPQLRTEAVLDETLEALRRRELGQGAARRIAIARAQPVGIDVRFDHDQEAHVYRVVLEVDAAYLARRDAAEVERRAHREAA